MDCNCGIRTLDEAIDRISDPTRRLWAAEGRALFMKYIEMKDEEGLWKLAKERRGVSSYYVKDAKKLIAKGVGDFPCRP